MFLNGAPEPKGCDPILPPQQILPPQRSWSLIPLRSCPRAILPRPRTCPRAIPEPVPAAILPLRDPATSQNLSRSDLRA